MEVNDKGEEKVLGRGGFGVVVKGTYRLAPVAIKRLRNQSPEQQEAFLREMSILRACRGSRYIVPFVGASLQPVRALTLQLTWQTNAAFTWSACSDAGCHAGTQSCASLQDEGYFR